MASNLYHRNLKKILDRSLDLTTGTFKVMLVGTGYTPNKDHEFVSDVVSAELSGTGYTGGFGGSGRKTISSITFNYSDSADKCYVDGADPSAWSAINAGTIAFAIFFKEVTNDASSPVLACIDVSNYATDGGNFTLEFDAALGIFGWAA